MQTKNEGHPMETRELYKQKYEAEMREWSARLEVMKGKTEKLA